MVEFETLLSQLIEKTDLMLQALKVDDVDIFIDALDAREVLIQTLQASGSSPKDEKDRFASQYELLASLDLQVNQEIKKSQDRLKNLITDTQKEQVRIKHFDAKASKYVEAGNQMSGHYFDKKK